MNHLNKVLDNFWQIDLDLDHGQSSLENRILVRVEKVIAT